MTGRLIGKRTLVTGVSSGIGAACARLFTREGAPVSGLDVGKPPLDLALVSFHEADVREEAQVKAAVEGALHALGGIDVVINAAGVAGGGPAHLCDLPSGAASSTSTSRVPSWSASTHSYRCWRRRAAAS